MYKKILVFFIMLYKFLSMLFVCVSFTPTRRQILSSLPLFTDISKEKYDLLAVGRALLSDHEWVLKMKEGRLKDVIPYSKEALLKLY